MRRSVFLAAASFALVSCFAETSRVASIAGVRCAPSVELGSTLQESRILILGELHGTKETPHLAGEYACKLASRGGEVVLALEVANSEQSRIETYLESEDAAEGRSALLAGPFWSGRDGRTSVAMADLVARVRDLRRQGLKISIIAMDGNRAGLTRDAVMAEVVRDAVSQRPSAHVVALVGNVHGIKERGAFFDPDYESFGYLLASLHPITLNVQPRQGSAWVCLAECGVHAITPTPWVLQQRPGVYIGRDSGPELPYHGTIVLADTEASPRAKDAP